MNIWKFVANQQQKNTLASLATSSPCRQRSGHEWTASSPLDDTRTVNLALVHRAYERGVQEVHHMWPREDESTDAKFFCNQAQNWWSLSLTAALVAIFENLSMVAVFLVLASMVAGVPAPTGTFWKSDVLGKLQESVLYEMTDKSLRVKLVIVSLFEHNLNQQISLFNFSSLIV